MWTFYMKRWTIEEEIKLYTLIRTHFEAFRRKGKFNANSAEALRLHQDFGSSERDAASLLYRLTKDTKLFTYASHPGSPTPFFRCKECDDKCLYDFSVCTPLLKKAQHADTIKDVIGRFDFYCDSMTTQEAITQVATELTLSSLIVEKLLVEAEKIRINDYLKYERVYDTPPSVSSLVAMQTAKKELVDAINKNRKQASKIYHVHERDGAEIIFSSDGTGFGKSYGVFESYADYIERFQSKVSNDSVLPESGFTNFLFLSPLKSQIDLERKHIKRIESAGGEFICVLSQADTYDLDFVDWASEHTNRQRYQSWCKSAGKSGYIKAELSRLKYLISQSDWINEQLKYLNTRGGDAYSQKIAYEEQLSTIQYDIYKTIVNACKKLFDRVDADNGLLRQYIIKGLQARKRRAVKKAVNVSVDEVYLDIIKQVMPFEVCQFIPSVMLMTTSKFDTTTLRLVPKQRGEGMKFESVRFEHLIGGKLKHQEEGEDDNNESFSALSEVCDMPQALQAEYLRNVHFKRNPDCPFRQKNIRFTVVIDELHSAYDRLVKSCHKKLVSKENNLSHVISVLGRIYQEVENLRLRDVPECNFTAFERESVALIDKLKDVLDNFCELSKHVKLDSFLKMFNSQLGAFEVNSDAAERVISITKNIFSFNAKVYVNEQALKKIRLRHVNGNNTRIELYYEVEGDSLDTNPTLHDLFQLVSAMLAACSQITNAQYKRWIKNGGQELAPSQNTPLGQFVDAANKVSAEVRHIFERDTNENTQINHFYTYLLPKTVFTMAPVETLNVYNQGAERTVILAFEMDLIKEMPEAMIMRMLSGTNNKVLGLSATSGFTHTKNGNFSRNFLSMFGKDLGYKLVSRSASDIPILQNLRSQREKLRDVTFNVFDAESAHFTDTFNESTEFKSVFREIYSALELVLKHKLRNPYKQRQINRELEALLLAAYDRKNTLVLALSGEFKTAFIKAYWDNKESWQTRFGICLCKDIEAEHEQIFELTPFRRRNRIRVVFFDSALARTIDVRKYTKLKDPSLSLVFMSTYNSAGTGLNYFATYVDECNKVQLDVDFQRLVLANSSFYSEVKGTGDLNTLPNYVSLLKHMSDSSQTFLVKDMTVNFAHGDNYRLLMAEHFMSLFKVIVQAIGRVERRDTNMHSQIFIPSDVIDNVAFQFAALKEDCSNEAVLECMSLLNFKLKEHCENISSENSFSEIEKRKEFEEQVKNDGKRIQQVHQRVLTKDWINKVRSGNNRYLPICNLFRDPLSFTNPKKWLEALAQTPEVVENKHMMSILTKMFIPYIQGNQHIKICHKRGSDGLPEQDFWALSDYAGGAGTYAPELRIFPQYSRGIDYGKNDVVGDIIDFFSGIQKTAFTQMVPHPEVIPLLKGNVGEAMFDMVLKHYDITPLSDQDVFSRLSPLVYEFFDRYIEVEDTLVCIDVKNWTTSLDNFNRDSETIDKSKRKIEQVIERSGENEVHEAVKGKYEKVIFVYVNTAFSLNPNNLMSEGNADHSVHYFNLFKLEPSYEQQYDYKAKRPKEGSRLDSKIRLNQQLLSLLK